MTGRSLTAEQADLVERIGVLHDRLGFSPAPGRVLGLLLVSPRPELTFDEIRQALKLSKGSTSAAINLLLNLGSIEYRTRPGERKRFFRKAYGNWEASFIARIDAYLELRRLLEEARGLHEETPERSGAELQRMIDFLGFLEKALHEAYDRYQRDA